MMIAADQLVLLEHRHGDQCADARDVGTSARQLIAGKVGFRRTKIGNMDRLTGPDGVDRWRLPDCHGARLRCCHRFSCRRARHEAPRCGNASPSQSHMCAELASHRRIAFPAWRRTPAEVAGRTGDDLQHLGGGGLLLQATSRSSLSSRVFSMAMTACAAKFFTSSICLSVNGRTSCR